jgi:uncharacterized membrane protein
MCSCSPNDQVRLIQAGYIGGTPVRPQSVITIRLLRFFHIVWKYCSLRFLAFAQALNEFLDPGNALFLTRDGNNVSLEIFGFLINWLGTNLASFRSANGIGICRQQLMPTARCLS